MSERPLIFRCAGAELVGVLNVAMRPQALGVLIVVGGPQYRVGSHRQFVALARTLEANGFASLRFDYRGMGDSAAPLRSFESVDDDIRAAIDAFMSTVPELEAVVLWGLCDGASAALIYAPRDPRVAGVVALNPWVRTEASLAAVHLNHYYKAQILSAAFWKRLLTGDVAVGRALSGLAGSVRKRLWSRAAADGSAQSELSRSFIDRMGDGWHHMRGRTLVILSGNDFTAREFADFCRAQLAWRDATTPGPNFVEVADADHTFSRREWKHVVEQATVAWLRDQASSFGTVQHQRSA